MYAGSLVWVTKWRMVPLLKKSRWAGAGLAVMAVNHRLYYHLSPLTHLSDIQQELAAGRWLIHKEGVQWWRCIFAHNQHKTQWAQHFRSMGDTQCLITSVIDLAFGEEKLKWISNSSSGQNNFQMGEKIFFFLNIDEPTWKVSPLYSCWEGKFMQPFLGTIWHYITKFKMHVFRLPWWSRG